MPMMAAWPSGAVASASSARSTAAASALPPPSPPPTGIRFTISMANPPGQRATAAYASAARQARFRSTGPRSDVPAPLATSHETSSDRVAAARTVTVSARARRWKTVSIW